MLGRMRTGTGREWSIDEVHPKMTPEKMSELIKKLREEEE